MIERLDFLIRNQTNTGKSQLNGHFFFFFFSSRKGFHTPFHFQVLHAFSWFHVHGGSEISKAFKGQHTSSWFQLAVPHGYLTHVNICSRASLIHRVSTQAVRDPHPPTATCVESFPRQSCHHPLLSPLKMPSLSSIPVATLRSLLLQVPRPSTEICPMDILNFPNISIWIVLFRPSTAINIFWRAHCRGGILSSAWELLGGS